MNGATMNILVLVFWRRCAHIPVVYTGVVNSRFTVMSIWNTVYSGFITY